MARSYPSDQRIVVAPLLHGHPLLVHGRLVWVCYVPIVYSASHIPASEEDLYIDADYPVETLAI